MKFKMLMTLALIASNAAFAADRVYSAKLDRMEIDRNDTSLQNARGAEIAVDLTKKEAVLTVYRAFHCPKGALCAELMMMPAPLIVRLPIVSQLTDSCGTRVITASRDLRRTDGALVTLEIRDNSNTHCGRINTGDTHVLYTLDAPRTRTQLSSLFDGERLSRVTE